MTEVPIPFQDLKQTVADAISSNVDRALEGEERAVAFQVLFDASPSETMGELFDRLDANGRELVNKARSELGLESLDDIESRRAFELANAALPPGRDDQGRVFQGCHAPSCEAFPLGDLGEPVAVSAKRWFCSVHEHLAQPGDLDPPDDLLPRIDFATMQIRPSRAEEERQRREEAQRIKTLHERDKAKREDAERLRQLEEQRPTPPPPAGFGPEWSAR